MKPQTDDDTVPLDRAYLRRQTQEALSIFVAPLSGIIHAIAPSRRSSTDAAARDEL